MESVKFIINRRDPFYVSNRVAALLLFEYLEDISQAKIRWYSKIGEFAGHDLVSSSVLYWDFDEDPLSDLRDLVEMHFSDNSTWIGFESLSLRIPSLLSDRQWDRFTERFSFLID